MDEEHEWDDEDSFKADVVDAALQSETVNYQVDSLAAADNSWVIVELFTGDRFKVSIEQVREDAPANREAPDDEEEDG